MRTSSPSIVAPSSVFGKMLPVLLSFSPLQLDGAGTHHDVAEHADDGIAIVGVLFMGTALDEECRCREAIYTGGGLAIIGTGGLILPRKAVSGAPDGEATAGEN